MRRSWIGWAVAGWMVLGSAFSAQGATLDVAEQTSGSGDTTLGGAGKYRSAGQIGVEPDWSRWADVAGLPTDRYRLSLGTLGDRLYAVGGSDPDGQGVTNVFCYDGTNWTEVAGLPVKRWGVVLGEVGGALIATAGAPDGAAPKTNTYRFDGAAWTEVVGLPAAYWDMKGSVYNGALYVVGGSYYGSKTNVYRFDGTNWTEVAGLPVPNESMGVAEHEGHLYAVGGINASFGEVYYTNAYRFDGTAWEPVAGLPEARGCLGAGTAGGALFAVGGEVQTNAGEFPQTIRYTNVYRFNETGWTEVAGLPRAWSEVGAASLGGVLYVAGGLHRATNVYRYPAAAAAPGVAPGSGFWTGGFEVVILGTNLCDGTLGDVTGVTLCGVAATVTGVSGSTQIVVTAGAAAVAGAGDVRVFSTSCGETVASNTFDYLRTDQAGLTFAPASPQAFGVTHGLSVSGGSGTGAVSFAVTDGPGQIADNTNLVMTAGTGMVTVVATKAQDGLYFEVSSTATVAAARGGQTIDFSAIGNQIATGRVALAATASSGLAVSFAVASGPGAIADGTNLTFTGAGTVEVVASQAGNTNWLAAAATNEFDVLKASAQVFLLDLSQAWDGAVKTASATTMPSGLTVEFTYDGTAMAPSNPGVYAVTGTVNDVAYAGTAAGTLEIVGPWDYGKQSIGGGWWRLGWFGDYAPMGVDGWVWHNQHGFVCMAATATMEDIWMFTADMGWLWTAASQYPFLFRNDDGAWLWYNGQTNPRWFYNFTTETWESR